MSSLNLNMQCRTVQIGTTVDETIEIDLAKNFELRKLYLEYPYFPEVLKWMNDQAEYSAIQHFHTELQFASRVLPELKIRMIRLGLLKVDEGKIVPCFNNYYLTNIPMGNATQMVLANHVFDSVVRRAGMGLADLKIQQVKARAPQSKILEWMKKLSELHSEVESYGKSDEGEIVVFSSLTTVGE